MQKLRRLLRSDGIAEIHGAEADLRYLQLRIRYAYHCLSPYAFGALAFSSAIAAFVHVMK